MSLSKKKKILVAMAKLLLESRVEAAGVRLSMDVFPLDSLVEAMNCDEVTLHWLKCSASYDSNPLCESGWVA